MAKRGLWIRTPLRIRDLEHVRDPLMRLRTALSAGLRPRLRIALKALRDPDYLAAVRSLAAPGTDQAVGIGACSPGEVEHALASGFWPEEISVTGTNLSEPDCAAILAHHVHVNADRTPAG
jgi:diaminopimelate decarboxylase